MAQNPLVEVFGYPTANFSAEAVRHREGRLCPYHNSSGLNCTKSSATNPLGVCTVADGESVAITCPVRFRQNYLIVADAARFFFAPGQHYVALTEVRITDQNNKAAGNIDLVLAALDDHGHVVDFGALEVQAVYISGNVNRPFQEYMKAPDEAHISTWPVKNYPKPDYLSSSRKRLAPQLIYKGGILNSWGKKMAVAVHSRFFDHLPVLPPVAPQDADLAWLVYDLVYNETRATYLLTHTKTVYTAFETALVALTRPNAGAVGPFMAMLETRIQAGKFMGTPAPTALEPNVEPMTNISLLDEDSAEDDTHG